MAIVKRIVPGMECPKVIDYCDTCNVEYNAVDDNGKRICVHRKETLLFQPPKDPPQLPLTGQLGDSPFMLLNHIRILNGLSKLRVDRETLHAVGIDPEKINNETNIYFVRVD